MFIFWPGAVPFHIAIFPTVREFVKNTRVCIDRSIIGQDGRGRGNAGGRIKKINKENELGDYGDSTCCPRCAYTDWFHTVTNICSTFGASEAQRRFL
jgi:hypothetical protein